MSRSLERTLTVLAAIFVAVSLLWLAVPRTMAAFTALPANPLAERLYEARPLTAEQARQVIESRLGGLEWTKNPSYFSDLSRAYVSLGNADRADRPAVATGSFDRAVAMARAGVAVSPVDPWSWVDLAVAHHARSANRPELLSAFSTALVVGPNWPGAAYRLLDIGLVLWPALSSGDRSLLMRQARNAWRLSPQHYVMRATTPERAGILRAALAPRPRELAQFETRLQRARKPR